MSQEFQQHWLSAYLDNELSVDERALVERRLEEDPEARQLLDDLRRVRGLVATLPGWSGPGLQFDMGRLTNSAYDEEDDLDVAGPPASGSPRSEAHESAEGDSMDSLRLVAPPAKQTSRGNSSALWRGLLSLAAGLLLLVLCVPMFWQRPLNQFTLEKASAPPDASRGGGAPGGMMGGVGGAPASRPEVSAFDSGFFGARSDTGAVAEAESESFMYKETSDAKSPPPAPASAPALAFEPPPSAAVAAPSPTDPNLRARQFGAGVDVAKEAEMRSALSNALTDSPNSLALQPADPARSQSEPARIAGASAIPALNNIVCARSDAWSEAEIAQALPELRTLLPDTVKIEGSEAGKNATEESKVKRDAADSTVDASTAGDQTGQALSERTRNVWFVCEVPKAVEVNGLLAQIHAAQPLTRLELEPISGTKQQKALSESRGNDFLEMPADKANRAIRAQGDKELADAPETKTDYALPAPAVNAPANPPAASQPPANAAGSLERFRQAQPGRLILFVTESEAQKILSSVSGSTALRYWRVVPTETQQTSSQADPAKKVVVILNQSP